MPAMKLKVWLDDVRPPPDGYKWITDPMEVILLLDADKIAEISLDHDLGHPIYTGYDVAQFIERRAYEKKLSPIKWQIHSANPVGVRSMQVALTNADKYWGLPADEPK